MFQNQTANCSYQFEFKFEFWYLSIFSNMWKIKYFCARFLPLEYVHYCDFLLIPKNISSYPHYVTVQEYFSHPSSVFYFLPTRPIKLRLPMSGSLLIANHLDQSLWLANQKHWAAVRSYLLHSSLAGVMLCWSSCQPQHTSSLAGVMLCWSSCQPQHTVQNCWAKINLLSQTVLIFLHPILICRVTYWAPVELLLGLHYGDWMA
jgi:hypothetical protein